MGIPLYLSPSRAIYRRISRAGNLKVCCDRSSCLTKFVILLGEWADVASEVMDLESCCFSRGIFLIWLSLVPSSGLSSALRLAQGSVRPCAQLGAQFGLTPSSGLGSALCPARGSVRPYAQLGAQFGLTPSSGLSSA